MPKYSGEYSVYVQELNAFNDVEAEDRNDLQDKIEEIAREAYMAGGDSIKDVNIEMYQESLNG